MPYYKFLRMSSNYFPIIYSWESDINDFTGKRVHPVFGWEGRVLALRENMSKIKGLWEIMGLEMRGHEGIQETMRGHESGDERSWAETGIMRGCETGDERSGVAVRSRDFSPSRRDVRCRLFVALHLTYALVSGIQLFTEKEGTNENWWKKSIKHLFKPHFWMEFSHQFSFGRFPQWVSTSFPFAVNSFMPS